MIQAMFLDELRQFRKCGIDELTPEKVSDETTAPGHEPSGSMA